MAEPTTSSSSKRVIVDGVDFRRIVLFPRIIAAAASALQPSRMVIALLMVVALVTFGRLWDAVTDANVSPDGLVAGRFFDYDEDGLHEEVLRNALREFAPERIPIAEPNTSDWLDTGDVVEWVTKGYRARRAGLADGDEVLQRRESLDEQFEATMNGIDRTRPLGDFEATVRHVYGSFDDMISGVFALNGWIILAGANALFVQTPAALWEHQKWFAIVFGVFTLLVLAIGGGAIARLAAVQAATGERLRAREGFDFALERWISLCFGVLLPLILALLICAVITVAGVLLLVPVLDVLVGLGYGLALLLGLLVAFLLVGYALGFPLLIPAVACEGSDGADAMQRAYAYVVARPLHMIGYLVVGVVGLAIGFVFVGLLASLTLDIAAHWIGWFSDHPALQAAGGFGARDLDPDGPPVIPGAWHERWTAGGIVFWQTLAICLVAAYAIAYFFSASTIIYLLMRRLVDGQEITEVWRPGLVPGTLAPETPAVREPVREEEAAASEAALESE